MTRSGEVFRLQQVYFLADGEAHVLSLTTTVDNFARLEPVFDGIVGSYKVNP